MDLQLTRALDGGLHINCGDDHRALGVWLEQEWDSRGFLVRLQEAIKQAHLGQEWQLIGREYHCQHYQGVIEVGRNADTSFDADDMPVMGENDLHHEEHTACCGLEDFEALIISIMNF